MGNEIVSFITAILSMMPKEVLIGLVIVIGLLIVGYDNKRKADKAAEEAVRRRAARKPGTAQKPKADE